MAQKRHRDDRTRPQPIQPGHPANDGDPAQAGDDAIPACMGTDRNQRPPSTAAFCPIRTDLSRRGRVRAWVARAILLLRRRPDWPAGLNIEIEASIRIDMVPD